MIGGGRSIFSYCCFTLYSRYNSNLRVKRTLQISWDAFFLG